MTGHVLDFATQEPASAQIKLIGTIGEGSNLHEGYPGYLVSSFFNPGPTNPFSYKGTGEFNAEWYCETRAKATPEIVLWNLGVNGPGTAISDDDAVTFAKRDLYMLDVMIGRIAGGDAVSWRQVRETTKHLVCLPIAPSSQDAFGLLYGTSINYARVKRNNAIYCDAKTLSRRRARRQPATFRLHDCLLQCTYRNRPGLAVQ